jgi:hypothetical protein
MDIVDGIEGEAAAKHVMEEALPSHVTRQKSCCR